MSYVFAAYGITALALVVYGVRLAAERRALRRELGEEAESNGG